MLVGLFRPVILLPSIQLSNDDLTLILKHELIHLKRYDLWYKTMILVATSLHWFNPLVYLMAKGAAEECEISCDALVLQNADYQQRLQYGEIILVVVRNGARLQTALSTNFYGGKKVLKNRIFSIMDIKRKKAGALILCTALVGIILSGSALASATNANAPEESITTVVAGPPGSDGDNGNEEVTRLKALLHDFNIVNSK